MNDLSVPPKYARLELLLSNKKWKEADLETARVILKIANRQKEAWLDFKSIERFPCKDLRMIDQLWLKYSNDRFGFSIQKNIWLKFQSGKDTPWEKNNFTKMINTYHQLGDCLGWRYEEKWLNYKNLNFDINAPTGHLPFSSMMLFKGFNRLGLSIFYGSICGFSFLLLILNIIICLFLISVLGMFFMILFGEKDLIKFQDITEKFQAMNWFGIFSFSFHVGLLCSLFVWWEQGKGGEYRNCLNRYFSCIKDCKI